jgi:TRAP-type mannitol/chloroaromatic compound transport system substrate-binding protein
MYKKVLIISIMVFGLTLTLGPKNNIWAQIDITLYGAGELAGQKEVLDMVSTGTVEIGIDWPGYWSGKNTAFDLLATQVLSMSTEDFMMWIWGGEGFDLYQEIYNKFNTVYLPFDITHMESGIRTNKPINSLSDLKGMKIRMGGLVAGKVLQDLGAIPVMISTSEIYEAMRRGTIDGLEFSRPKYDLAFKMYEVTKYWSVPGWHAIHSIHGLVINKQVWEKLPHNLKTIMEKACMAMMLKAYADSTLEDAKATEEMAKKVKIIPLSKEDLIRIEELASKIQEKLAAENPDYAKILRSQVEWLKSVANYRISLGDFKFGRTPSVYPSIK